MKGLINYYSIVYDFIKDQKNGKIYTPEDILVSDRVSWRKWTGNYDLQGPIIVSDKFLETNKSISHSWYHTPYLEMNQEKIKIIEPFPILEKKEWIESKIKVAFPIINKLLTEETTRLGKLIFGKKINKYIPSVLIFYKISPFSPKSRIKIGLGTVEYPLLPFYRYWIYPSTRIRNMYSISCEGWYNATLLRPLKKYTNPLLK